jgi:hypothetical protein
VTKHLLFSISYHFIAYWLVGLPSAAYLAFIARPSFGLEGLWYGYLTATGMLTALLLLLVVCISWEKEVLRARGGGGRRGAEDRDVRHDLILSHNYINLNSKEFANDEDDDILELERVELGLESTQSQSQSHSGGHMTMTMAMAMSSSQANYKSPLHSQSPSFN